MQSNRSLSQSWSARLGAFIAGAGLATGALGLTASPAGAADFYKGKTVNMIVGYRAGGSYGTYARLLVRHYGKYLPGNPTFVVRNMPGAGSLVASNYLYNIAPKDGTALGAIGQSIYLMQQLKQPKIKFDAREFNWIGRMTDVTVLIIGWHKAKAKTIDDIRRTEFPVAVGGTMSGSTLYVSFLNELAKMKFKPIKGYSSASAMLALERGEIDGTSSVTVESLQSRSPTWVPEKKVNVLLQVGLQRDPTFKDVPNILELFKDANDKAMIDALVAPNHIGRAITAPPGLPADRVALLRSAFDKAVASKELLADAKRLRHSINALSGTELQNFIRNSADLSPDLVSRMQKIVSIKYKSIKKKKKKKQ